MSAVPSSWTTPDARFRTRLRVESGVAVLALHGYLGPQGLPVLRSGVEAGIGLRVARIVLDMTHAELDHASIALLGLVRRYAARHGVELWLAGVPVEAMAALERLRVATLYRVQPTAAIAVAVAVGARRAQSRRSRSAAPSQAATATATSTSSGPTCQPPANHGP